MVPNHEFEICFAADHEVLWDDPIYRKITSLTAEKAPIRWNGRRSADMESSLWTGSRDDFISNGLVRSLRNAVKKSLTEIKEILAQHGLALGTVLDNWPPPQLRGEESRESAII